MVVASPPPPIVQSWADHDHAWRAAGPGVEATSDGGRHWRVVFRDANGGAASVTFLLRTSGSAGVVGVDPAGAFVTSDAGRHWYQLDNSYIPQFGRGGVLFSVYGIQIYRTTEWPPRAMRCGAPGRWFHDLEGPVLARNPLPRNICLGAIPVRIRMRVAWTVPAPADAEWTIDRAHGIPGGVAGTVTDWTNEWRPVDVGTFVFRDGVGTFSPG